MKNYGIETAIKIAGSQKALAKKCGLAQSTICDWLNGKKPVSPKSVPDLVEVTGGKVPAYRFRPDLPKLFPHPESE
ncbi:MULTISPECIES: helix-turn-helix domain-containing protein [unclassified Arsenophonus]|uniref:transcriptional regulator n=1 Tax=unclassified Arsenophonus TaxID=2627083 RepID=UPI00285CF3EA|nr:helix-turn-helix domain-containing protein [Arsenophonus sp.]MDR5611345.1 helix-turn-helix domain-containing protein [Arsenophonus sp.]MDR5615435.1 helix-turn-helix domain-containing protein [Arsenophonus sp.]